jgi:tetratricopeptide (TPR) repeat protein
MLTLVVMLSTLVLQAPAQAAADAKLAYEKATAHFDKNENEQALAAYDLAIKLDPSKPGAFVGKGRTLARLRRYDEAFAAYGEALARAPNDAMILRYRGHNYINVRKLDLALADLTKAETLIEARAREAERGKGVPASERARRGAGGPADNQDEFGIYYHLALAYYLTGDYAKAAQAYDGCVRTSTTDGDRVSCWAWQYPALVRAGRKADADAILAKLTPGMDVGENAAYLDRLLLFKGVRTEGEVAATLSAAPLNQSTAGYGLGLWHLLNGRPEKARPYFEKATSSETWQAFGYIAAEMELRKMK